jgi:hypothetical protein
MGCGLGGHKCGSGLTVQCTINVQNIGCGLGGGQKMWGLGGQNTGGLGGQNGCRVGGQYGW